MYRKHEKTHTRPWKCSEPTCKYHEDGWPTEKERDRHMNDKHSSAPPMYRCQFHPCPYESKRESNCKQHMEKAHGWTYVRSKNNGKSGKRVATIGKTPPTPQTTSPASNAFSAPTPDFSDVPTGHESSPEQPRALQSPTFGSHLPDTTAPFHELFGAPTAGIPPWSDAGVEYSPILSQAGPSRLSMSWDQAVPGHDPREEESLFGADFNWSSADPTLTAPMPNLQLATPATSVGSHLHDFGGLPYTTAEPAVGQPASLSPGAQADAMLCSPYSVHDSDATGDEGLVDYPQGTMTLTSRDFSLFDTTTTAGPPETGLSMFGDLPPMEAPTGWSGNGTDLARQLGYQNDAMEE